jgi:DNA-binding NarL/FixJ family response regulator
VSDDEIRVLIVDDGESMRRALRLRLEGLSDIRVVAEAGTPAEAVHQVMEQCPDVDVAIVSCTAPGTDYIEAARRIKDQCDGLRVVVLAPYDEGAERALAAGASAHLLKETDIGLVADAIRLVAVGHQVVPGRDSDDE